jgi:ubiquinone/menaquinone biosynthesis C-methylase UbiE
MNPSQGRRTPDQPSARLVASKRSSTLARKYDRSIRIPEFLLFGGGRQWACSKAEGDVLEIALGTGRNLLYYPASARVSGIELSPRMLEIAKARARGLGMNADLRQGDAEALEFPDASFDTVVCTLGLCTIPDDRRAIAEAWRVLRPGGRLVLLEHVRSPNPVVRSIERLLEKVTLRLEGDHQTRDPIDHLASVGFVVETLERLKLGIVERVVARKPV